jgi:acylphosphatase
MTVAVRIVVHGRVQGVWFRAWTREEAERRGLSGWVRNRRDGTVEALFAGEDAKVEEMIAVCRDGPPRAQVTQLERFPAEPPAEAGFQQKPTS